MSTRGKIIWAVIGALFVFVVGLLVIAGYALRHYAIPPAEAYVPDCKKAHPSDPVCTTWATFRAAHPYPYQAIAGKRLADTTVVLVISEPPQLNTTSLRGLAATIFGDDLISSDAWKWGIGADGWVQDLVLRVKGGSGTGDDPLDNPILHERVALLHKVLFGTTFGGDLEVIVPPDKGGAPPVAHDLRITASELSAWIDDASMTWHPVDDENIETTWNEINRDKSTGAFASGDGTLIMLTFPTNAIVSPADAQALEALRVPFRQFAVASDDVFGGVWTPGGQTAILARARTNSLSAIPPLRFETFALLAASQKRDELSQSYERNSLFAGKLSDGVYKDRDWAPIFLSGALINTEFGALLNITDQMLKSWSEAGHVEYLYFTYPKPKDFPFGRDPLSDILRSKIHTKSVLFNWNTSGSAVIVRQPSLSILTARQTGALPITYGGDNKREGDNERTLLDYEDTAYKYFAGLRDPNLGRVVQYTVIYQLFRAIAKDNKIAGIEPADDDLSLRAKANADMSARAEHLLDEIKSGKIKTSAQLANNIGAFYTQHPGLGSAQLASMLIDRFSPVARKLDEERKAGLKALIDEQEKLRQDIDQYNSDVEKAKANPELTEEEATALKSRSSAIDARQTDLKARFDAEEASMQNDAVGVIRSDLQELAFDHVALDDVRSAYVKLNDHDPDAWIKTPSIVLSWDAVQTLASVGGHNLTAHAMSLEESSDVTRLTVNELENGEVVVRYNPNEKEAVESHASEIAREVEHRGERNADVLLKILETNAPVRARNAALEVTTADLEKAPYGRIGGRAYSSKQEFVAKLRHISETNDCCLFIAQDEGRTSYLVEKNPSPPPTVLSYESRDTSTLVGILGKRGKRGATADKPVIFIDQPEAHVKALTTSINEDIEIAGWLREPGSSKNSGIVETDLRGRRSVLRVVADIKGSARELLERMGVVEPAETWRQAQAAELSGPELADILKAAGWNENRDGLPSAIKVTFGGISDTPEMSIVAGLRDKNAAAHVMSAHTEAAAEASRKGATIAKYLATIRNDLRALPDDQIKRLVTVVQAGEHRTLVTRLDRPAANTGGV